MKAVLALSLLLGVTSAAAADDQTSALAGYYIAENFCKLHVPDELIEFALGKTIEVMTVDKALERIAMKATLAWDNADADRRTDLCLKFADTLEDVQ